MICFQLKLSVFIRSYLFRFGVIFCFTVTDRETRSRDIGAMLSLERDRSAKDRYYLTAYQWLDICIAICKIILDVHEQGAIVNDLTIYNVLIR